MPQWLTLYSMRGAFVVRLGEVDSLRGKFEGSAEEVDTGKRLKFRSAEELLGFLEHTFVDSLRRERELKQRNEEQDNG
jgi:hypothetical protein